MGLLDSVRAESVYGYCLWVLFELKSLFLEKFCFAVVRKNERKNEEMEALS